ncbi:monooxygenase [Streptomyces eurocidicus]|uniref:3-(3-hydroxy-phenyl)propionate hydroxylase n=1 Tax=Streptomyces eurocidicus TaxID=66423 RepID=A0A2N8NWF3_STREU|nr:FAD-dependent monooxygenase [Streptomyces eurocidicus]MBB5122221.1 3-(3-hydroxy-phenyl)propionate hydroxylase [Streptomyces eurocidicus]MBF6055509.1 monooxygenase [Streptomyces eurocidicus]PNE33108.1 monooxygenase [Streptomyces eurocidicus]
MDPVIIVGAGPVGLTLALSLARNEVPVVVLDEAAAREGGPEERLARTAVLRPDTAALLERLGCATAGGARWTGWRTLRRRAVAARVSFADQARAVADGEPAEPGEEYEAGADAGSPLHLPQHVLTRELRAGLARHEKVRIVPGTRVDTLRQDPAGISVHTRGDEGSHWRGSYLVGCDGARSTVRKLLGARFPGRTAVERYAVAALRAELPWPGEAVLHRSPPRGPEVTARPLPDGVWRLDWLLPPGDDLVTPDTLLALVRDSLTSWCGEPPPYELLDTGVHAVHHRLTRRMRTERAFLAGDAAHLLGALGTQGLDEGLRDAENLSWKLTLAWHQGASETLLDSYQAERRGALVARLRAADRVLPAVRGEGGWSAVRRTLVPGAVRGHDELLTDGHLGRGSLGAPPFHARTPLAPAGPPTGSVPVGTAVGEQVEDVPVTAPDGSAAALRDRLGGALLVVLVAPGTGVWERRHWLGAGLMPRLAAAVGALPLPAELLVAEGYPGAAAHTVLLVRPDGCLVAALAGVRAAELAACADAVRGGAPGGPSTAGPVGDTGPDGTGGDADGGADGGVEPSARAGGGGAEGTSASDGAPSEATANR